MRFFNYLGQLIRNRQSVSGATNIQSTDIADPTRLTDVIRQTLARVVALEAKSSPEAVEFECDAIVADMSFAHGFNSPVRWWVTSWRSSASNQPKLTEQPESTLTVLVLESGATGTMVLRIEPSPYAIKKDFV